MLKKNFYRQAKITAGETLSGLETGPFGGFGHQDLDPQVREKRCPQGLVLEIEKTPGYANDRRPRSRLNSRSSMPLEIAAKL